MSCEAMGLACEAEGPAVRCGEDGEACGPYDAGQNVCDPDNANAVKVCVGGEARTIDCGQLGKACVGPTPDGETARCE